MPGRVGGDAGQGREEVPYTVGCTRVPHQQWYMPARPYPVGTPARACTLPVLYALGGVRERCYTGSSEALAKAG